MDKKILVFGGGGHAKTVISMIRSLNEYEIAGIIDDGLKAGELVSGVPILGGVEILQSLQTEGITSIVNAVGAIGNFMIRWRIYERLTRMGFDFPTLVHPTAFVEDNVTLAEGVQVCAQSYISSESIVGFGTLINAGVIVSHDCQIGRCVNLSPGSLLGGEVTIGDFSQVGMGATVNSGVMVGTEARIGNGATVKNDVPDRGRVFAGTVWPYNTRAPQKDTGQEKIA